jgi:hypothetical protein
MKSQREYILDEIAFCQSMIDCPYYQSEGTCVTGCQTEPYCCTGIPVGGWEGNIAQLQDELEDLKDERE